MESYHQEEEHCRRLIKKKYPNHPIAKKYFPSTYKAVEAYWAFFRYIEAWERRIKAWRKKAFYCPKCGNSVKYQDPDALDHGYSILVCRKCGYREFDD